MCFSGEHCALAQSPAETGVAEVFAGVSVVLGSGKF